MAKQENRINVTRESVLLVSGVFTENSFAASIGTTLSPENIQPHPKLAPVIQSEWERVSQPHWKPIQLLNLDRFNLRKADFIYDSTDLLSFDFSHTNGKDFIGASRWKEWKNEGLDFDFDQIPQPPVTSTVLITADRRMIIQTRGASAHQGGNIDALGGHIDPKEKPFGDIETDANGRQSADIFYSAKRELMEELALSEDQINNVTGLGLIYNYSDTSHYAIPFVAETSLSSNQVLENAEKRAEAEKKDVNLLVADIDGSPSGNPNHITSVIRDRLPNVDPEARLTIALARRFVNGHPTPNKQYGDKEGILETFRRKK